MGLWRWEGFDANGKRAKGKINANNDREVRRALRAEGCRPKKIYPPSVLDFDFNEWMIDKGISKAFGRKELGYFTKQLSTMINAGVPILQSLDILYTQEKNPALKRSVENIMISVGAGKTLAESMTKEKGFDKLYCNLVKAGEKGGILDEILLKLSIYMDKQAKTRSQIKSALTYPVIVCIVGAGVIYGMMFFVVPQFTDMLKESGQETPLITQLVVDFSQFLIDYTKVIIPVFIFFIIAFKSYVGTKGGKKVLDMVTMRMPIFGPVIVKGNLNAFSRTLATMLTSGVSLIDALEVCIDTLDNVIIADDIGNVRLEVMKGKTLTEPLSQISYFPPMVSQMIKVGEQTGGLDAMLTKISDVFEDEVNELVGNMTKMIEPIILVVLGGAVAIILVAMYLPIFMSAGGSE